MFDLLIKKMLDNLDNIIYKLMKVDIKSIGKFVEGIIQMCIQNEKI